MTRLRYRPPLLYLVCLAMPVQLAVAADYVELVDSKVYMPPPSAPTKSYSVLSPKGFLQAVAEQGPWYNKATVYANVFKALDERTRLGFSETASYGQKGFLIKVQVLQEPVQGGLTYYSLLESGVGYVGAGPDADSVCVAVRCDISLAPGPTRVQSYAEGSGYYWITPARNSKFSAERYEIDELNRRTSIVRLNTQLEKDYRELGRMRAITDYTEHLKEKATTRKARMRIEAFERRRTENLIEMARIETELKKELRKAKRAAAVSKSLDMIATAFSLASTVAMANAATGEDVSKAAPGDIKDVKDVKDGLNTIQSETDLKIKSLQMKQETIRNEKLGIEAELTEISIEFQLEPNSLPVMRSPP